MFTLINSNIIRVNDLAAAEAFYVEKIGMRTVRSSCTHKLMKFVNNDDNDFKQTALELVQARNKNNDNQSVYWKFGISLCDVNLARKVLVRKGIKVSQPSQFEDIGYLCSLADFFNNSMELLQQKFESNFQELSSPYKDLPLLQPATFGQITLRVSDIDANIRFYSDFLGMKLLSIQDVSKYGFQLYFFAWMEEDLPYNDVTSVSIREWLWQRPFCTLELQYKPKAKFCYQDDIDIGFGGIRCFTKDLDKTLEILKENSHADVFLKGVVKIKEADENANICGKDTVILRDPQNVPFHISQF